MLAHRFRAIAVSLVVGSLTVAAVYRGLAADEENSNSKPAAEQEKLDFQRDIKPIFVANCYDCHGEDLQESGLRLDMRKRALEGGDSGKAIVPGKSSESALIARVTGDDPGLVMPPESEGLSGEEVAKLRTWIDQGADWPDAADMDVVTHADTHWAYQPIERPEVPATADDPWVQSPLDAFVLAKLRENEVDPSPPADRRTLIRRLSLDLLGLPPGIDEVDAIVDDSSADAYEKLVDRLLESPHFGERWGRHWLDMARYADSDGYEKDNPRPNAWRWRDWVIEAINDDMPFDQFTIEQLAGDLLPNATAMQKLATAFNRQTLTNTEGGTDQEEFRVEAVFDRVETVGTVWMGLTVGCARCHTHKYDQITQREYFELFAFFNNGDEANTNVPVSDAAVAAYEKAKAQFDHQIHELEAKLETARSDAAQNVSQWEQQAQLQLAQAAEKPATFDTVEFTNLAGPKGVEFQRQDDGSYLATGKNLDKSDYTLTAKLNGEPINGFRLETLGDENLPAKGPGRAANGNFVLNEFSAIVSAGDDFKDSTKPPFSTASADHSQNDFPASAAVDGNAKTGWAVGQKLGESHAAIFLLATPIVPESAPNLRLTLAQQHGNQHNIGRFRIAAIRGLHPDSIAPQNIRDILAIAQENRSDEQKNAVREFSISRDSAVVDLTRQLTKLEENAPKEPLMNVRVIVHRDQEPRETHVLARGDFLQPSEKVQPGVLEVMHPLALPESDETPDRLDLARWLVSTDNPLTPRVAVNHIWQHLFGRGLVRSVDDFGVRGEQPTHPELLNWLASEYLRVGWSRKEVIKQIVMSSTYRQSSAHRPELAQVDPENDLLSRQNRFRAEAEIVRDLALAASGLLSPKIGGPSVFPPMPEDVAALSYANNFKWKTSEGGDRYRRGMYTFFKRTAPHPTLMTFDCPDSNKATVDRSSSNTPLQALTTLNNMVFTEAARALASRVIREGDSNNIDRLKFAYQLCVARPPTDVEQREFLELFTSARNWYGQHADAAVQAVGEYQPDDASPEEAAAWVATARIILNTDEFITRE